MIKIKLHSITDLITNSSTVIFTYSENSVSALTEMIDELFKTFNINKKCEDVFDMVILCEENDPYTDYIARLGEDELPEGLTKDININDLVESVKTGKTKKPEWFKDVETAESEYDYFTPSTMLYLIPKDEEYKKLGDLIEKFLYSTDHTATRDG